MSLADLDEAAIKSGFAEASRAAASAGDDMAKATAQIEVSTYSTLARAVGVVL